jgi:tetratricopeptide (TPR) repeat protein
MDNFFELERRCRKYHIKKWMKPVSILFLLVVIALVIYFSLSDKKTDSQKIIVVEKNVTNIVVNKKISNKVIKKEENNLTNKEKDNLKKIPTLKVEFNLNKITTTKKENSTTKKSPKQIKEPINIELKPKEKEVETKKLIITTKLSSFKKSFELMNLYFNNEDYVKAKEWAIKANKVKPYNEDVWNIYALSLYRLDEKQKAIEVLETYLKYKESQKLENTLKIIEQGENK